jgi:integrase
VCSPMRRSILAHTSLNLRRGRSEANCVASNLTSITSDCPFANTFSAFTRAAFRRLHSEDLRFLELHTEGCAPMQRDGLNAHCRNRPLAACASVPMLKENSARMGFIEQAEFEKTRAALPDHLKPLITLCYQTGVRLGEATGILRAQVDLENRHIVLMECQTKSGKARILPISTELAGMLVPQENWKYAFSAKNLRKEWLKATKAAGCDGVIFHDLRRSAVRNMMRAGVQQAVAMKISGHTTTHIFQRYNIVDESDIQDAAAKVESFSRQITSSQTS